MTKLTKDKDFEEYIKGLIGKAEVSQVINELKKLDLEKSVNDELTLVQSQYNSLKRRQRNGIIDQNQISLEEARVRRSLLEIINLVDLNNGINKNELIGKWVIMKFVDDGYKIENRYAKIINAFKNSDVLKIEIHSMYYPDDIQIGKIIFDSHNIHFARLFLKYDMFQGIGMEYPIEEFEIFFDNSNFGLSRLIRVLRKDGKEKYLMAKPIKDKDFEEYIKSQYSESIPDNLPSYENLIKEIKTSINTQKNV